MKKSSIMFVIVVSAMFGWEAQRTSSFWVTPTTNLIAPAQTQPGTEDTPIHPGPGTCHRRCARTG